LQGSGFKPVGVLALGLSLGPGRPTHAKMKQLRGDPDKKFKHCLHAQYKYTSTSTSSSCKTRMQRPFERIRVTNAEDRSIQAIRS
jgi:hypothetical protein